MENLNAEDLDGVKGTQAPGNADATITESAVERYLCEDLASIPVADRIDLYEAIKGALPPHKLQDLDLAEELVLQFMRVKELQVKTISDRFTKANQKAQVANSVAAILAQLTKLQTELHTAERFKTLENMMIRHLRKLPLNVVEEFMNDYEQLNG